MPARHQPAAPPSPSTPLGVFAGGHDLIRCTLGELFERIYWPYLIAERDAAPRNREPYLEALAHWRRLTDNPPLADIGRETLLDFRMKLRALPGRKSAALSLNTVNKHLRQVRALLAFFGPADGAHPDAIAVLANVPRVRLTSPGRPTPQHVTTLAELQAMIAATPRMTRPRQLHCPPGDWWAALLLVLYYTGWRIGDVLRLRWPNLAGNVLTCGGQSNGQSNGNASRKSAAGDAKQLADDVIESIERVRPPATLANGPPDVPIFPWPCCRRYLNASLDRLQTLAGIPAERARYMKFHGVRKRHGVEVTKVAGAAAAQSSLGHTSIATTMNHYVPRAEASAPYIAQLPSPRPARDVTDDRQLSLFD